MLRAGSGVLCLGDSHTLRSKQSLKQPKLAYEIHGQSNTDQSNMVLIHHALSPSHHVASFKEDELPGWWEEVVGPGKAIDTQYYCVICINNLGSCFGSTGPSDQNFPQITIQDMVDTQVMLLDQLDITQPITVIGNSMGAMLSLQMAIDYPERVKKLWLASSAYKAYPSNVINRAIQKAMIEIDIEQWQFNAENDASHLYGFRLARALGHYTYRHPQQLNAKFPQHKKQIGQMSEVENYFQYNVEKFTRHFNPYAYLCLLDAMDLFDVTQAYADPIKAFQKIRAKTWVLSVDTDILFTPDQQLELYQCLQEAQVDAKLIEHRSDFGHDAFLVETEAFSKYLSEFMSA